MTIKRCATCGRFRTYEDADTFCTGCGNGSLEAACTCGRPYDYALAEEGAELHCPRCGREEEAKEEGGAQEVAHHAPPKGEGRDQAPQARIP